MFSINTVCNHLKLLVVNAHTHLGPKKCIRRKKCIQKVSLALTPGYSEEVLLAGMSPNRKRNQKC